MANYLRENPLYIDTVPVTVGPPLWGKIYVRELRWENFAVGDRLHITTGTGGTLIDETIETGNTDFHVMRFGAFGWVNGLVVQSIGTGTGGVSPNITVSITKA